MKNGTRIFLIILIVLLMLGYIAAFTYCTVQKYANADELISNDQIVNFNQIFNAGNLTTSNRGVTFTFTKNSSNVKFVINNNTGAYYFAENLISLIVGHKYLIFTDNDNFSIRIVGTNGNVSAYTNKKIVEYASGNVGVLLKETTPNGTYFVNYNIIDLTAMGYDNFTLDELNIIFSSQYYAYTIGTPILTDNINSYNNGYTQAAKDILSNANVVIDNKFINGSTVAFNYGDTTSSFDFSEATQFFNIDGYCQMVFPKQQNDTLVSVHIEQFLPNYNGSTPYYQTIFILNSSGVLVPLAYIPISDSSNLLLYDGQINVPANTEYLYMALSTSNNAFNLAEFTNYVSNMTIQFTTYDINGLLNYAYQSGSANMQHYYTYGEQGYLDIYDSGKAAGVIEANTNLNVMQYVKTAFATLGEILMIQVFPNFTLGAFFMLPLITSAIFFVIKIAKGGS